MQNNHTNKNQRKKYSYVNNYQDRNWFNSFNINSLSDSAYMKSNSVYKKDEIRYYLSRAEYNEKIIREISHYLYTNSTHYLRLIKYFTNILTLDSLLIPKNNISNNIELTKHATDYISKYNIKHEFKNIINILLIEDMFFGYEVHKDNKINILKLPIDYCRVVGNKDGIRVFEFNFSFFDSMTNKKMLNSLPNEFRRKYNIYKQDKNTQWQLLNPNYAICFKLMEELDYPLPLFASLFEEIINLQEKKDLADVKERLDNYKLIVQTIPLKKDANTEKDIIFSSNFTKKMHHNVKKSVPSEIGVVTTPMQIESISLQSKKNSDDANLSNAPDKLINSSGFGSLFSGDNKSEIGFKIVNKSDQSLMFQLLRQFERFFNNRLSKKFNNEITIIFPDLSIFNKEEKTAEYLKLAQFGYSKILVAISNGFNQNEFLDLMTFEESLELSSILKPLQSTHTQVIGNEENIGRPKKEENQE